MTSGNTPPRGNVSSVRRRAFLAGTLRASGVLATAAAACDSTASHTVSRGLQSPSSTGDPIGQSTRSRSSLVSQRPNDGSGFWADFSNTGYEHHPGYVPDGGNCTHGYKGLNDYAHRMKSGGLLFVDAPPGHVFNQIHFRGKILLGHSVGDNWTFNGCVFDNGGDGAGNQDFITQTYLPTSYTQNYCTFKPIDYRIPPGNDGTVSSAHTGPGTPCAASWQSFDLNSNGFQSGKAVVRRHYCDIWGNAGMQDVFNGTADRHVVLDHCYIHDQADIDGYGGCGYHQDGIGPSPGSNTGYIDITNCTLTSLGNTNGIAYQVTTCHDMMISGNYFSGWGYTVNLGGTSSTTDTNVTFENNVYSWELSPVFGPMYSNWHWNSDPPINMNWRGNRYQFHSGDPHRGGFSAAKNGHFWWPSDNVPHKRDYTR
jgi:hypothetical protein